MAALNDILPLWAVESAIYKIIISLALIGDFINGKDIHL